MADKIIITRVSRGAVWPSGKSKPLAQLDVDDAWVVAIADGPLISDVEEGLGPWTGIGGKLPLGTYIELLRYDHGAPRYNLLTDFEANSRETLNEFLAVTGLKQSAIYWRHPEA